MAYYTALITAWNGATQPPTGVTGTGLTSGMTTAQKLAAVNGWVITGTVPTSTTVQGTQLLNCINWAEFNSLTAQQQDNLLTLVNNGGMLVGGSANTGFITDGMFLAYFSHSGATISALTALAQAIQTPWWQANGYPSAFNLNDVAIAGLS